MLWRPQSKKVQRYKEIRKIGRELSSKMIGIVPKEVLERAARDMGILHKGTFVFDSEEEMSFIQDRIIYDIPWDGKTAIEHFEAKSGSELSEEERKLLESMKKAYFSLFEVVGGKLGESVQLSDLLSGNQIELMDISMSSITPMGALLATRIIKVEDICMTSGAVYPFLLEQKDALISGLKATKTAQRDRKKRSVRLMIDFSDPRNYSLYFYRKYKRLSQLKVRMSDELFE